MATAVETMLATAKAIQAALLVVTGLQLTGYMWPQATTVTNGATYDIIIVGAGPAGSILANRLTEEPGVNVLLIEAGGDPPLESVLPGIFSTLVNSENEYSYTTTNDGYTSQNLKNGVVGMTAGKMLGGSSSLGHFSYIRGYPSDFQKWAQATGDGSWDFWNLLPYFIKTEKVEDADILSSYTKQFHGTDGLLRLTRQPAADNAPILEAYNELGINTILNSNNPYFANGVSEPLFTLADGVRQSAAEAYLRPLSGRSNFHILKNTQVTKVLFNANNDATGVEALTSTGETITINANLEVILSAGVFNTPKLLMLSGVGPKEHLSSFNITVISDLPVGQNLQDHIPAVFVYTLAPGDPVTAPPNPHLFPSPMALAYTALNPNQGYPDYQTINLIIPPDNTGFLQFCSIVFGFADNICQGFFDSANGRSTLFTVNSIVQPESRGEVLLRSADPADAPVIKHGIYSNEKDLHNMALYLQDSARIVNTTSFKNMGASLIEVDLPDCNVLERNSYEYWRCYALKMSGTMWCFSSTSSMGPVLDNHLRVRGVQKLRVVDASAIPNVTSGHPNAAVSAVAERAADLIKQTYGPSPRSM